MSFRTRSKRNFQDLTAILAQGRTQSCCHPVARSPALSRKPQPLAGQDYEGLGFRTDGRLHELACCSELVAFSARRRVNCTVRAM